MNTKQKTILIVDDEETLTWSMSKNLSLNKEYKVICANSGEEAMELLDKTSDIDLIVCDIKMQGKNGLQVLDDVKEKYPQIRCIIMTAYGSSKKRQEAMGKGAIRYIEKPFMMDQVKGLIKEALEESNQIFQPIDKELKQKVKNNQALQELLASYSRQRLELLSIKLATTDGEILLQGGNKVGGDAFNLIYAIKLLTKMQNVNRKVVADQLHQLQGITISAKNNSIILQPLEDSPFFLYLVFEKSLVMGKVLLLAQQLGISVSGLLAQGGKNGPRRYITGA